MEQPHPASAEESRQPRWRFRLSWPVVLLLAWLIYEFTALPGLAAAVTCWKFGWSDFRAARWLRRVDPDEQRGRACFWFYLAFALWKIALFATLVMVLLLFFAAWLKDGVKLQGANGGPSEVVVGVLVSAGLGFGLSFLATYVALGFTLRDGVKVWLGDAPRRARLERHWPPHHGRVNAAPLVAVTTLILTLWGTLLTGFFLLMHHIDLGCMQGLLFFILFGGAFPVTMVVFKYLERAFARTPEECWASDGEPVVYEDRDALDPDPEWL
jgi:hypothetical protein